MTKKTITHLIIDTFSSNPDFNGDCDYILVELTPQYVANLLKYMERVVQMHREDKSVYCLEAWDYSPSYFSYSEQFEALRDVHGNQAIEVPRGDPILLDVAPHLPDDCFQRVECQTVQITDDGVSWTCYTKHTNVHIGTAAVDKKTLLDIQRRFGVEDLRRSHHKRPGVHPAIRRIHDLLYLDLKDGREFYNADKQWDSDTMSAIAEIVTEHIPRPK